MIRKVALVAATDFSDDRDERHARWLPVAAAVLGISDEALRLRMSRQTIRTRLDSDGRVNVRIPYDLTSFVRDGITMPEALAEEPPKLALASQSRSREKIPRESLYESRIDELKGSHGAQLDDLKAIIVELADRHHAEIDRLLENHRAEVARLMELHQATARLESENKKFLLGVISSLSGRK